MDPTDLVGQLILSVLIGEKPDTSFVSLAKTARANGLAAYGALTATINEGKTSRPPRLPLTAYEGRYWNVADNFCIAITTSGTSDGTGLLMKVQDAPRTSYHLKPYNGDTFYWPPDREKELCEKGMWLNLLASSHKIVFGGDGQRINHLFWHYDAAARPEMFRKSESSSKGQRHRL